MTIDPNIIAAGIGAAGSLASSAKGTQGADRSSKEAMKLQQQALALQFPSEVQEGRANFANSVNQQIAPNFIGDQGLAPGTGFRDIAGGDSFNFEPSPQAQAPGGASSKFGGGGGQPSSFKGGGGGPNREGGPGQGIVGDSPISSNFSISAPSFSKNPLKQAESGFTGGRDNASSGIANIQDSTNFNSDDMGRISEGVDVAGDTLGPVLADAGMGAAQGFATGGPGGAIIGAGTASIGGAKARADSRKDAKADAKGGGDGISGFDSANLLDFSGQGGLGQGQLGALNQLADTPVDSRIDSLVNQQLGAIQGQQGGQQNLLSQFSDQIGNIGAQSQGGLQDLMNQASGAPQDLASLIQGGQAGQAGNQDAFNQFLGVAGGIAGNNQLGNQFTDPLQNTLQQAQNLTSQPEQDANRLIAANEEQSRFEQDQAQQSLNDQLAARGLTNSSAAIDALSAQNERFSRGRAQDAAGVRSQAQQTKFNQQLGSIGQAGNLASQGGQLTNALANTQLRGAGVGGDLANAQGRLGLAGQGQNSQELFNLFQAGRQGRGDMAGMIDQLSNQRLGTAETQFNLGQQQNQLGLNNLQQQSGLLQGNEARAQGINQQAFANRGAVSDRFQSLFSQLFNQSGQAAGQAAAINAQSGRDQFANSIGQSQGAGQAFAQGLGFLGEAFQNRPAQTGTGGVVVPPAATNALQPQPEFDLDSFFTNV